jgi:hypothetical protein
MRYIFFLFLIFLFSSCQTSYEAEKLDNTQYSKYLQDLAPYVNKKHEIATFKERFDEKYKEYYLMKISEQKSYIKYFYKDDSLNYFYYVNKDLSSLFEHYRGHGGYFVTNEKGYIAKLEIMFYTPRMEADEVDKKGLILFKEMITNGNVNKFLGNKEFIHTPNEDFYYNVNENKWDYTENSSWRFLEESKEPSDATMP